MKCFEGYVPMNRPYNKALVWDYDTETMDNETLRQILVTRTIQIGKLEDFYAIFDMYGGFEKVKEIAKNEITDLDDRQFNFMCHAFNLKKTETQCYKKRQSRKKHLNS